jgi:anaphase-promoting complex subunit 6
MNKTITTADAALGFTHHLRGDVDAAIECYHRALGVEPRHAFASAMLHRALKEI